MQKQLQSQMQEIQINLASYNKSISWQVQNLPSFTWLVKQNMPSNIE